MVEKSFFSSVCMGRGGYASEACISWHKSFVLGRSRCGEVGYRAPVISSALSSVEDVSMLGR